MARDVEKLKAEFNGILARVRKGGAYLKRHDISQQKKEAAWKRYKELLGKIADLTERLTEGLGREPTRQELLEGFGL